MQQNGMISIPDFEPGSQRIVTTGCGRLLVCRTDDAAFALDNDCPHAGQSLFGGVVTNDRIRCPFHGAVFDLRTGQSIGSRLNPLRLYPTQIRDGEIKIILNTAELKDKS
ncbi:Rieske (2Fe-2S) protein [Parasphingorhabdus sp.]|uniref:Rieske (2Fe-2S) protein n=1 Tax=Parasphingorhabdus sp. TaxID=2709688 RepID=UPI0032EB185B